MGRRNRNRTVQIAVPHDQLTVTDRKTRQPTQALHNLLEGSPAFLLCSGPSANAEPLELLGSRGMWTMAVNNAAGHARVRPQAFVCSDPPLKFSHSIWLDPAIMKFVPTPKLRGYRARMRIKKDGQFADVDRRIFDCPNVWGFNRHSWLMPDDSFFNTDGANWGNHNDGVLRTGQPKTVCTMLLALRLLRYLGASTIFLVGVDFRMSPDRGYSFPQERTQKACDSNNSQFSIVNSWLCTMQAAGVFERAGLTVFNCYRYSGLRAFPHVPLQEAVEWVHQQTGIEKCPDLAGWYEK